MPRSARLAPAGLVHHALNRAGARLQLYGKAAVSTASEPLVEEARGRYPSGVLEDCVMPRPWHVAPRPDEAGPLADSLGWLTRSGPTRWRADLDSAGIGHLFPRRYQAFAADDDQQLRPLSVSQIEDVE